MRLITLLSLAVLLLPTGLASASFDSEGPELAFPLRLPTSVKVPTKKKASNSLAQKKAVPKQKRNPALPAELPPPAPAEPKVFVPPQAARIVPNGILSTRGPVQPIVASGAPITPNGIISIPNASPVLYLQPVNPATREAELAQLELAQFLYSDYPAQMRQLDSQIAVTQAEITALQLRLANYSRFDKFINNANPLFESQQLVNVALVAAQQQLSNLQFERGRLQQWLPVEIRRRQLELNRMLPAPAVAPAAAPAPAVKRPVPYDATFDDDKDRNNE